VMFCPPAGLAVVGVIDVTNEVASYLYSICPAHVTE
jgi:hypothetical protein